MSNLLSLALTTATCITVFAWSRHVALETVRRMRARDIDASLRPFAGVGETALAIGIMAVIVLALQESEKGIEGNIVMVVLAGVITSSLTRGAFKPLVDGKEEKDGDDEEEEEAPLMDGQVRGPAKLLSVSSTEAEGHQLLQVTVLVDDERTVMLEDGVALDFMRIASLNGAFADTDDVTFTFKVENDRAVSFEATFE